MMPVCRSWLCWCLTNRSRDTSCILVSSNCVMSTIHTTTYKKRTPLIVSCCAATRKLINVPRLSTPLFRSKNTKMGDESDADWQDGLIEWGIEDTLNNTTGAKTNDRR